MLAQLSSAPGLICDVGVTMKRLVERAPTVNPGDAFHLASASSNGNHLTIKYLVWWTYQDTI